MRSDDVLGTRPPSGEARPSLRRLDRVSSAAVPADWAVVGVGPSRNVSYGLMFDQNIPTSSHEDLPVQAQLRRNGAVPDTGRAPPATMAARSSGPTAVTSAGEAPRPGVGGAGAAVAVPVPATNTSTAPSTACRLDDLRKSLTPSVPSVNLWVAHELLMTVRNTTTPARWPPRSSSWPGSRSRRLATVGTPAVLTGCHGGARCLWGGLGADCFWGERRAWWVLIRIVGLDVGKMWGAGLRGCRPNIAVRCLHFVMLQSTASIPRPFNLLHCN